MILNNYGYSCGMGGCEGQGNYGRFAKFGVSLGRSSMPTYRGFAAFGADPTLQEGSTGTAVTELQKRLNYLGVSVVVDGQFGPATTQGVKNFQAAYGLTVDGVMGPDSWTELHNDTDGQDWASQSGPPAGSPVAEKPSKAASGPTAGGKTPSQAAAAQGGGFSTAAKVGAAVLLGIGAFAMIGGTHGPKNRSRRR